ncbi:peroxiredoxin [Pontibacter ummariensis]|uniref:Thioredoxin peroxidase n=1 Tax=Pontibacter ummariensis TaxID=1610492 RepID=A0A239GJV9_9BACT|nr:redoxin domain-containing protein [Pontibacter ummariensis]PRY11307.1 peroxiredoxin [Pontibacter ummariensis]SNS69420.1 Peroxiredoxin [Pontibacter ummariensis]
MLLEKGTAAPAFELHSAPDQTLKLSDLKGKRVVLVFYPNDWSPVCGDQIALYNEMLSFFQKYDAEIIGISVDSKWSHKAYRENGNIQFPLLADFEPKGKVSKLYGAYNEEQGRSQRALFVLDEKGTIQWSYLSPIGENPGADGILKALEDLDKQANEQE